LGRLLLPTPLIKALSTTTVDEKDAADAADVLEAALAWPRLETSDEKALLNPILEEYNLNATAFLQFLDITTGGPAHFLETQLLHLPQVTTSSMAYGTAVHRALQTAQQLTNTGKFKFASVLQSYEQALSEQQLPVAETERYRIHGEQVLANLFKLKTFHLEKGAKPEVAIREARLGNARLGGKLDRIDISKDGIIIITDYKTGIPLASFDSRDQTKAIKSWRHRNQLLFYTLLVRQSSRYGHPKTIRGQMMYVEAEDPQNLVLGYEPEQESLDRIQSLVAAVWKHIMHLDFPDTSHYPKTIAGIEAFEADLLKGTV
ncbi:MAG TPA: PD-(D/E)XK nuclease family protein, partial [Candidatus Dormibacteraeota bacterium]|nr:PD-(D/E)XK nuclease family protein [Candidatus Dormibacteraeota bacterium]